MQNFIEDYRAAQRLIIGLLIFAELKRLGIDLSEKASVRKTIRDLVDPQSPTNLTDEGMRLLNAYASGGYDYLAEMRSSKPYTVEEFLRDFVGLVGKATSENPNWAGDPTRPNSIRLTGRSTGKETSKGNILTSIRPATSVRSPPRLDVHWVPMESNTYDFTAIRGIQAGSAYYVIMVPLKVVPRLFRFDDDSHSRPSCGPSAS